MKSEEKIFFAIQKNDIPDVENLLNDIKDINCVNYQKQTPLIFAIRYNKSTIIELFLNFHRLSLDFTLKDYLGRGVVDHLKAKNDTDLASDLRTEVIRRYFFQLVQKGDLSNLSQLKNNQQIAFTIQDTEGNTALHCAAQCNQFNLTDILQVNLETRNKKLETPIETAAFHGHLNMVTALLAKGAKVERVLIFAVLGQKDDLLQNLLKSTHHQRLVSESKGGLSSLLYEAAILDQDTIIQLLTDYKPENRSLLHEGITIFQHARHKNATKAMKKLLELGYLVDKPPDLKLSPKNPTSFSDAFKIASLRQQLECYQLKEYQSVLTHSLSRLKKNLEEKSMVYLKDLPSQEIYKILHPKAFFSYAWEEKAPQLKYLHHFLGRLRKDLISAGINVWYDKQNMHGDIETQMRVNVTNSHHIIFFGTRRYKSRTLPQSNFNVRMELNFAIDIAGKRSSDEAAHFMFALMLEGNFQNDNPFPVEFKNVLIREWQNGYQKELDPWVRESNYIKNLTEIGGVLYCLLGLNKIDDYPIYRQAANRAYKDFLEALNNKLYKKKKEFEQEINKCHLPPRMTIYPQAPPEPTHLTRQTRSFSR